MKGVDDKGCPLSVRVRLTISSGLRLALIYVVLLFVRVRTRGVEPCGSAIACCGTVLVPDTKQKINFVIDFCWTCQNMNQKLG